MKRYTPRPHAVDRALLRFGISSEQAESWFNQLMSTAKLIGADGKREVYDHKGKRIIIEGNEVITVMASADLPFGDKISKLVERELKKANRELRKIEKELSIKIAELTIEQATITLNFLKSKAPSARKKNKAALDEVNAKIDVIKLELNREKDKFDALLLNSKGYLMPKVDDI